MDLGDAPEEAAFRAHVRAWLADNPPPTPAPVRGTDEGFTYGRAWHRRLYDAGYAGLSWPAEHGGRGASPMVQVIFEEELGRAGAPGLSNHLGIYHVGPAIMAYGTPDQKQRFLLPMLRADEIWCQGFSEPNAGSDLAALQTRAVLDGDSWIVTGQKVWTTWGHHADRCQLLVRTDPDAPKHKGITCLLADMHAPGVSVRPLKQMSGNAEFNEVFFDDVRVPIGDQLGERGAGWRVAMSTLASERASVLTFHVRTKRQVRELAALAKERGKADDALVRAKLGACAIDAEALQLFSYWSASHVGDPGMTGSMAKLLWSELQQRIHETALEILGRDGVREGPWLQGLLDSRGLTIAAGTTEIQKNLIAERALGMPRA
jgi:alkylation response protein AidB-like acyl-CoA dehydrogenase